MTESRQSVMLAKIIWKMYDRQGIDKEERDIPAGPYIFRGSYFSKFEVYLVSVSKITPARPNIRSACMFEIKILGTLERGVDVEVSQLVQEHSYQIRYCE